MGTTQELVYATTTKVDEAVVTCHWWEVDSNQQCEEAGDVGQHVAVSVGHRVIMFLHWL